MKKFVIIGGGTAGWISAVYMAKYFENDSITLIESEEIGTIGFGEGTTPHFPQFLSAVGIEFSEFHENVDSTIKIGIDFRNWPGDGSNYYHDFDIEDPTNPPRPAFHFNNHQAKEFLKSKCLDKINHVIGNVVGFDKDLEGNIINVKTDVGNFESDFIIDCSGLKRLVIGNEYKSKWISLSDQLKVNSVVSFSIPNNKPIEKFTDQRTTATALKYGWLWQIPLKNVTNFGYVFNGNLISKEDAQNEIREMFGKDIKFGRYFTFDSGYYQTTWINNCVAVGLSSGFFEPIEATSIMITIKQVGEMIMNRFNSKYRDSYNKFFKNINDTTFQFIRYHYVCDRDDTDFWKCYKNMVLPEKLLKILNDKKRLNVFNKKEFFSVLVDSIFTTSSYSLLSQYNFKNKKEKSLL
jgi:tryptophan halogenase